MKAKVDGSQRKIDSILLTHKGMDRRYRSALSNNPDMIDADLEIEISDIFELMMLIGILDNFKDELLKQTTRWRKEQNDGNNGG